jgi:hypothetical protein
MKGCFQGRERAITKLLKTFKSNYGRFLKMSDSTDSTPVKEPEKRESIFQIVDDLIAHMNTTRNLFVLLITSAFIIAPIALVMAAILLSPPPFVQHDVVRFVRVDSNVTLEHGVPPGGIGVGVISGKPVGNITMLPPPPEMFNIETESPRFIFVGGPPQVHQPADITTIIVIFIAISVILASIWLFIGIKEYRFFSRWNKRYGEYMSLQSQIEKKLEE